MAFLVLSGHGVPEGIQEELYRVAGEFFDLPLPEKLRIRRLRHEQNRGYIPYGEERLVRMHGGDSPPDYKEVFSIGPCTVPAEPYYQAEAGYPQFRPKYMAGQPARVTRRDGSLLRHNGTAHEPSQPGLRGSVRLAGGLVR